MDILERISKWAFTGLWIIVSAGLLVSDAPVLAKIILLGVIWFVWRLIYPEE